MEKIQADIEAVEVKIKAVEVKIKAVGGKLDATDDKLYSGSNDEQLRKDQEYYREKKGQFVEEKRLLMEEKRLLMEEKRLLWEIQLNESHPGPSKRSKLEAECPAPSTLGNLSKEVQKEYSTTRRAFFNHRPKHGLHISLQVETFGKFQDELKLEEIPENKYMEAAIGIMLASATESNEQTKVSEYIPFLANVFNDYSTPRSMPWGAAGKSSSDISITNSRGDILVNFEIKRELSADGSEPILENLGYFIHFQKDKIGQRAPMFLVAIAGPYYLQVFGAAWNGNDLCMDPLSDPLSLLYVPSISNSTVKLARVFKALSTLAKELTQTTEMQKGPYFSHAELEMGEHYEKYIRVFRAKWGGHPAIVKFTPSSYGLNVHKYLLEQQLAPEIFHSALLPGNWFVVVMEEVGTSLPNELSVDIKASLKNVLRLLKEQGYVHGDLRRPNIRVVGTTVRVLDFDWAGKVGEARYPSDLNKSCAEWHPDVRRGQLIESEHDDHLISLLLQS